MTSTPPTLPADCPGHTFNVSLHHCDTCGTDIKDIGSCCEGCACGNGCAADCLDGPACPDAVCSGAPTEEEACCSGCSCGNACAPGCPHGPVCPDHGDDMAYLPAGPGDDFGLEPGEISEDGTCPRCGGGWGEDLTCAHCTTEDGDSKPTKWDAPGSTAGLIFEDGGRFYRREENGAVSFKRSTRSGWSTGAQVDIPASARPVSAARAARVGQESGRCLACHRPLGVASATGYGPECRKKFA